MGGGYFIVTTVTRLNWVDNVDGIGTFHYKGSSVRRGTSFS